MRSPHAFATSDQRRISVVVPTYHRHDLLERCLNALARQGLPTDAYEVIVADDAASAETEQLVNRWSQRTGGRIRYLAVRHAHGPAAARNAGWRAARGEVIAFTDDDCIPDPMWLAHGFRAFADSAGTDAAWGRIVMPLTPNPTDYERDAAGLERSEFVTANCFCRRAALEEVGGFDEQFTAAWREDADLYFSLLEQGKTVAHVPVAVVVHPVRPAPWGVSIKQQRKVVFDALLYKKHPQLFRQKIRAGIGPYYGIVASLVVAMGGALTGAIAVACAGALTWAMLTAHFCARRLKGTSPAPRHVAEMIVTSIVIPPLALLSRLRGAVRYRVVYL
jgi:cellulose synthase/poly-beta-1,6-N-acetylglucosamine synthase-like glycosyltransferase